MRNAHKDIRSITRKRRWHDRENRNEVTGMGEKCSLEDYYNNIKAFKEYVDKYSQKHQITVMEAMTHDIVKNVYKTYITEPGKPKDKK